jgi:hypothetical protein
MVAKEWGITPQEAEREILDDPEQLAMACLPLLRYSEAHAAFKRANKRELGAWNDNPMMTMVMRFEHDQAAGALGIEASAPEPAPVAEKEGG